MLKAHRYRLYPNNHQRELLAQHFGTCRSVYNMALEIKIAAYKLTGKSISAYDLIKQLPDLKKEFEFFADVNAQSLQSQILNLDKAYKGFFNGGGFPKFKSKHRRQSFQCPHIVPTGLNWESNTLSLPKIKDIPIVLDHKFDGKIKTVTITKEPTGKYFASILVDNGKALPEKASLDLNTTVGIDLGVKSLITLSTGRKIDNPRYLKNGADRLAVLQRRMSRKKKGSQNYKKARYKVAKCHEKIRNQRKDFNHKISSELVRDNQTISMEDLTVKGMTRRVKPKTGDNGAHLPNGQSAKSGLNKAILDSGFGALRTMIEYKCTWYGKNFVTIDRFAPSSKQCNNCGIKNKTLTLADREWTCENCDYHHDRDENAAKNIRDIGYAILQKKRRFRESASRCACGAADFRGYEAGNPKLYLKG